METQYTISEAKNKLPSIVHSVERGPSVKLTRRGRPVAILLSIKEYENLLHKNIGFWNALTNFRKQVGELGISDKDFVGLRDRSSGRTVDSF